MTGLILNAAVGWNGLTLSWQRSLSYRNQPTDLKSKSIDWFLYDIDLRQESLITLYIF